MDDVVTYADGIGPDKRRIEDDNGRPVNGGALVEWAHARGLLVHPYTFRAESVFLGHKDQTLEQELRRLLQKLQKNKEQL